MTEPAVSRPALSFLFLLALLAGRSPGRSPGEDPLKVYISVDMEGVAGVVTEEQLGPEGFEYQRFREFMTAEALAAVEGARAAGAAEILVSDSHGNKQNLLVERFPKDVRIIRGGPRRLSMMSGIDATFGAALFIGYHASAHSPEGVRAHTFSSARLTRVALNGEPVSEGAFNAAIAGHFGVPVIFVAGDDAAIAELRAAAGDIPAVETKRTLGFHAADTLTPAASAERIARTVREALERRKEFRPRRLESPVVLEVGFKSWRPAEVLSLLRIVRRTDARTIRYEARDVLDASDFLSFLTSYTIALEP